MHKKLQIEDRHWCIIKTILSGYPYQFYAFGSRVKGTARPYSDLDLCYKDRIDIDTLIKLQNAFEDSDLPYRVDLTSWDQMDIGFREMVKDDLTPLIFE